MIQTRVFFSCKCLCSKAAASPEKKKGGGWGFSDSCRSRPVLPSLISEPPRFLLIRCDKGLGGETKTEKGAG